MPDTAPDLQRACSDLFPQTGIEVFQSLGPDPIPSRACAHARDAQSHASRDAKGRFATGHSGNPKGRPAGIRNPRRRPLGLLLRQARPGSLASLIERKRYLRLPLLRLVLPPPARQPDPGQRLGIDFSRMRSAPAIAAAIGKVLGAVSRGEIAPTEALCLVRRARKPLRAIRRRLWRRLARLEATRRRIMPRELKVDWAPPPLAGEVARRAGRRGQTWRPDAPSTMRRMVPSPAARGRNQIPC